MVAACKPGERNQPRLEALHHFQQFKPTTMKWQPGGTLAITVLSPNSESQLFRDHVSETMTHAQVLAGSRPLLIEEKVVGNDLQLLCSGPAAPALASAIRDDARVNFTGSASIPKGPGRNP